MNRRAAIPLLIALLSISALGVASTTLETSLTTDPDDEINPDWDRLPIGQSDAASIQEQIEGGGGGGGDGESGSDADRESDNTGQTSGESGQSGEQGEGTGSGFGLDSKDGESTLFDRLLALLIAILRVLVPLLVLVAFGALVYRYRGALLSLFGLDSTAESPAEPVTGGDAWPGAAPSNVVDRAWLTLVERVDPDRPETITTAECRTLARERGLDAAAVDAISTAFERVHYGGFSVTEEAERARTGLRQLEGGTA